MLLESLFESLPVLAILLSFLVILCFLSCSYYRYLKGGKQISMLDSFAFAVIPLLLIPIMLYIMLSWLFFPV